MALEGKTLKVCSCNRTLPLDGKALAAALKSGEPLTVHTELCRKDAGAFQAALGEADVIVACTQEAPLFGELAEAAGSRANLRFVNVREHAGWGTEGAQALPKIAALDLGADLENLPRITIEGFASQKTFAYRGEFVVKIGQSEVILPVVFSENPQASNILGRIGFFDQFNIVFNADNRNITISRRAI